MMSPLRGKMLDDMVVRHLASRTQEAYVAAVAELAKYYGRSPQELSEGEVSKWGQTTFFAAQR